jgi:murein DD-endopeptidase MepM/ murein hydrolase activator NlpD
MFGRILFLLKFSFYCASLEYRQYFRAKILSEVAQLKVSSNKRNSKNNRGFYIALGVCLIAVGAAAWTTYDSVTNYTAPQSSVESKAKATNDTVSGIFVDDTSSAPVSSAKPVSSSPASSAAAVVSSKAETKQTAANANTFTMPVSGKVTQPFSKEVVYCKTLDDYRAHTGVDLGAKTGEAVKACADGVVTKVANDGLNGNTIVIKHGTIEATYCGLDKMLVKEKQNVKRGDQIGTVGVDPMESLEAPHLRLIMKKNGEFIDPMTVLK